MFIEIPHEFNLPRILDVQKIETPEGGICIAVIETRGQISSPSQLRLSIPPAQLHKTADPPVKSYASLNPFSTRIK